VNEGAADSLGDAHFNSKENLTDAPRLEIQ
jgi:hypothetical protein